MVGRAVANVLAQTFAGVEVVVVDDGSIDDSVAAARAVSDGRVHLVRQHAVGVDAARRSGIRRSRGHWVAVLDPDDEVAPGWLARLGRLVDATDAVLVSCGGEQVHPDGSATTVSPTTVGPPLAASPSEAPTRSASPDAPAVSACLRPGAFVVRRDLLLADECFGDADAAHPMSDGSLAAIGGRLVTRILSAGLPVVSTPEPLVRWNAPPDEVGPDGEALRLRWALQSLDALARTPIPDPDLMVRSATIGAISAIRLDDPREARRLFGLARSVMPEMPRLWIRWAVSWVPPLAARVWAVADSDVDSPNAPEVVDGIDVPGTRGIGDRTSVVPAQRSSSIAGTAAK